MNFSKISFLQLFIFTIVESMDNNSIKSFGNKTHRHSDNESTPTNNKRIRYNNNSENLEQLNFDNNNNEIQINQLPDFYGPIYEWDHLRDEYEYLNLINSAAQENQINLETDNQLKLDNVEAFKQLYNHDDNKVENYVNKGLKNLKNPKKLIKTKNSKDEEEFAKNIIQMVNKGADDVKKYLPKF
ncbi:hypothetical protein Mgra_00008113 [Meloidogyne graminicola]|uniref:Uncharacterized protein n=1 Tax=Meloidogyne graminicola TaxID=189291 RepID=A0A8S9ZGR6_9BILA|nr:hypothetical protein Mgra_00008113 [Meloidogyne graminicola]